jgi:hypothetical protein
MFMERIGLIICAALCVGYLALNLVTATKLSAKEMRRRYITGQCVVGRIAAGIFYAPAWLFKGIKFIILYFIAVHKTMNGKIGKIAESV